MSERLRQVLPFVLAVTAVACSGDRAQRGSDSVDVDSPRVVYAVQVAAFSDSTVARRFADSLSLQGWQAYMTAASGGDTYRVRVSPSVTADLPDRVAHALRGQGTDAISLQDTVDQLPTVESVAANGGVRGMAARVRWMVSPNGRALLLVHDPVNVEAEALPDGFVYASERDGIVIQRDSVWDVVPSADWEKLAYAKAFVIRQGEGGGAAGDSVQPDIWGAIADASGMPDDSVRANAFSISGMALIQSYVRPSIIQFWAADPGAGTSAGFTDSPLYVSGGWRIRWATDTSMIALGDAPVMVQDDSPPRNWLSVHLPSGQVIGTTSQTRLVPPDWRLGPVLDISVPLDIESERVMRLEGVTIISSGGWIRSAGRMVGPGVALAATRDGHFIAALAPRPGAREYESPLEPVLYKVVR